MIYCLRVRTQTCGLQVISRNFLRSSSRTADAHMKIERFVDCAVVMDGGTITCRAVLGDGTVSELGLDARIPKTKAQRHIFIGAGYPTLPNARILERGSREEQEVIAAIEDYIDRTCGFLRRESLMDAEPSTLDERDRGDLIAVSLMKAIADR